MPPRASFLDKQRRQIANRLQELHPAYEEYLTLVNAQEALESVKGERRTGSASGTRSSTTRGRTTRTRAVRGRKRGPGRPPGTSARRARGGRRRAGQTRADQALALISAKPGITVPEIAKSLGIRQNYLYRVIGQLQKERKVRRRQRGYHPA
jgi:hypothetical protein